MESSKTMAMSFKQFPLQTYDKVRYADTDRQGHVNNSVYNQFFETGRVELLYHPEHPLYSEGCSFVIANAKVDFLREIKWPGLVHIGTAVTRIGNSSIQLLQGLFQDELLVAKSDTVIVQVNNLTAASSPLSAYCKESLQHYQIDL